MRHSLQSSFYCLEVDDDADRGKVKASGNRRDLDDLDVGSSGNFGKKKRSGSHDGRHELASGGGRGFDSAGKMCGIAHALHERDRIDTVHHDVGHGASRDGAKKALVITEASPGPPVRLPVIA